jgi:hypothetical protein
MHDNQVQVDRFLVRQTQQRDTDTPARMITGKKRHEISEDNLIRYLMQLRYIYKMYRHCSSGMQMKPEPESQRSMSHQMSLLQNKLRQELSQPLKNMTMAK